MSVEAAEASLGEAAFDRALVPERAGSGGEDLAPIGAMGRVGDRVCIRGRREAR